MGRKSRTKRERRARVEDLWLKYRKPPPVKYPVRPRPSGGVTAAERTLAAYARQTFLSMWSYPNVVRDERRADGSVVAKEIVDLLVVFEDDVILFSDKDCAFPSSGNLDVDWSRWYRKAIEKAARQLWGAERHIWAHPDRVYIDPKCQSPLPVPLPAPSTMRVHRVVVAHGASTRCKEELGGTGSLVIRPRLNGHDHCRPHARGGTPFCVGRINAGKPFVHVLDDKSLSLLLGHLDTVSDFVRYLIKREAFISRGQLEMATGEEALLGCYMKTLNSAGEHDFETVSGNPDRLIVLEDRLWWDLLGSPEYGRKRRADGVSYLWDHIIEQFIKHYMAGTSEYLTDGDSNSYNFEKLLRFFARENRFRRRLLSGTIMDMLRSTKPSLRRLRVVPPIESGDPYWVLLLFPFAHRIRSDEPHERYREVRRHFLHWCLRVVKMLHPEATDIVGFATETDRAEAGSEDAGYLDARVWSRTDQEEAQAMQEKLGILVQPEWYRVRAWEYPPDPELLG